MASAIGRTQICLYCYGALSHVRQWGGLTEQHCSRNARHCIYQCLAGDVPGRTRIICGFIQSRAWLIKLVIAPFAAIPSLIPLGYHEQRNPPGQTAQTISREDRPPYVCKVACHGTV